MTFNSSSVSAGDLVTAANNNNQRLDALQHAGDTISDAGSANAYDITVDNQIITLVTGQVAKFIVGNSNTGASTLRVHNATIDITDSIVRPDGSTLKAGDLIANMIAVCMFDGTNWQLLTLIERGKFGGDGSDGELDTSGGTVDINLGGSSFVELDYSSINIVTNNLTFSNGHSEGSLVYIRCRGNAVISATIDGSGDGSGAGSAGTGATTPAGTLGAAGSDGNDNGEILDANDHFGVGGAVGATFNVGGTGPSGGAIYSNNNFYANPKRRIVYVVPGAGGGGGGGGSTGDNNFGAAGNGGGGGAGGIALVIEVGGAWDFSGTINLSGAAGSNGSNGSDNTGSPGGGGGGGGAGGGGAGGMLLVLYNSLIANTGSVNVAGGAGGSGGTGGNGAGAATGGGGGAGGSGGGGYASTGGSGGNGGNQGSTYIGGTAGSSGGGNGGNASGSTSSPRGGGGGGGAGGANGLSVITQNNFYT